MNLEDKQYAWRKAKKRLELLSNTCFVLNKHMWWWVKTVPREPVEYWIEEIEEELGL